MEKSAELQYYSMKRLKKENVIMEFSDIQETGLPYMQENQPGFIRYLKSVSDNSKIGYYFYPLKEDAFSTFSNNIPKITGFEKSKINFKFLLQRIDNKDRLIKAIRALFAQKEPQFLEVWLTNENDAKRCISIELKIYDDFIMVIMENVTLQKNYEQELLEINKELEAFLYKSSHNLKGPAASISGLVSIAMNEVKDEVAVRYLNMIRSSTEKMNFVLADLLNINKIKLGHLEPEEISIQKVIDDVMESLKFLTGNKNIQLNVQLSHKKDVLIDSSLIYSVFQNIIENAIKYSQVENPLLTITSRDVQGGIEYTFADNGQGIPEEAQSKIFDMFFRANDVQKGSGLGLYIVKTAVQKLKGNITLESKIGAGTTFRVYLPDHKC